MTNRHVIVAMALGLTACGGAEQAANERQAQRAQTPPPPPAFTLEVPPGAAGPYPANYKALVAGAIRSTFFDPYSVRDAVISKPVEAKANQTGWMVCVAANAKNAYGAYTGRQVTVYVISYGAIVAVFPSRPPATIAAPGTAAIAAQLDSLKAQSAEIDHRLAVNLCSQAIERRLTTAEPLPMTSR